MFRVLLVFTLATLVAAAEQKAINRCNGTILKIPQHVGDTTTAYFCENVSSNATIHYVARAFVPGLTDYSAYLQNEKHDLYVDCRPTEARFTFSDSVATVPRRSASEPIALTMTEHGGSPPYNLTFGGIELDCDRATQMALLSHGDITTAYFCENISTNENDCYLAFGMLDTDYGYTERDTYVFDLTCGPTDVRLHLTHGRPNTVKRRSAGEPIAMTLTHIDGYRYNLTFGGLSMGPYHALHMTKNGDVIKARCIFPRSTKKELHAMAVHSMKLY